jgi:hypothetical protein
MYISRFLVIKLKMKIIMTNQSFMCCEPNGFGHELPKVTLPKMISYLRM